MIIFFIVVPALILNVLSVKTAYILMNLIIVFNVIKSAKPVLDLTSIIAAAAIPICLDN